MRGYAYGLLGLLLVGCGSTPAVRQLANSAGVYVSSLETGTADFIDSQNRLNEENTRRLNELEVDGAAERASVREQRLAWIDADNRARVSAQAALTSTSASDIVAGLDTTSADSPQIDAAVVESYASAGKALSQMALRPKLKARLMELIGFGEQVSTKYTELQANAKAASDKSAAASAKADVNSKTEAAKAKGA